MYVENLCENCVRGPYICNTKNCKEDRVDKYEPTQYTTITSTWNSSEYTFYAPESTDHSIQPCAFDSIPEYLKGQPMMLYCSCPRCSPRY